MKKRKMSRSSPFEAQVARAATGLGWMSLGTLAVGAAAAGAVAVGALAT